MQEERREKCMTTRPGKICECETLNDESLFDMILTCGKKGRSKAGRDKFDKKGAGRESTSQKASCERNCVNCLVHSHRHIVRIGFDRLFFLHTPFLGKLTSNRREPSSHSSFLSLFSFPQRKIVPMGPILGPAEGKPGG